MTEITPLQKAQKKYYLEKIKSDPELYKKRVEYSKKYYIDHKEEIKNKYVSVKKEKQYNGTNEYYRKNRDKILERAKNKKITS